MYLSESLERGIVPEFGKPDKVITTFVSNLFVFGEKVLKIYKHEPFFFADLKTFESRKEFFCEDFFWNNIAAPEIYLHLWGIQEKDDVFTLVPPDIGEDFIIEMSRIDDSQTLTNLLINKYLNKEHCALFIDSLVDTLATLTKECREHLSEFFSKGLLAIMRENIASMHTWLDLAQPYITKEESAACVSIMLEGVKEESYFAQTQAINLSAAIDNNSENLLLVNGRVSFIDIMPPMKIWRVVDEYSTISRTIVDIEVLGDKELTNAARAAYGKYQRNVPLIAKLVYEIRAAAIQWSYRYKLKQADIAEKFGLATKTKMSELRKLLDAK